MTYQPERRTWGLNERVDLMDEQQLLRYIAWLDRQAQATPLPVAPPNWDRLSSAEIRAMALCESQAEVDAVLTAIQSGQPLPRTVTERRPLNGQAGRR